jgi:predicted nucleic acid-binding protein
MRPTPIVLDASAFVRAVGAAGEPDDRALGWIDAANEGSTEALAPEVLFAEVANALLGYVRAGDVSLPTAAAILDDLLRLPIRSVALRELAVPAFQLAAIRRLSVYDACYLVIAEQAKATLVTADRALAAAAADVILLD